MIKADIYFLLSIYSFSTMNKHHVCKKETHTHKFVFQLFEE